MKTKEEILIKKMMTFNPNTGNWESQGFDKIRNYTCKKIILTSQKNKDGECKIYVEILSRLKSNKNTGRTRISTDIWVLPINWMKKRQEINKNDEDYIYKNEIINKYFIDIQNSCNVGNNPEWIMNNKKIEQVLKIIEPVKPNKKTLTDYFFDYIELRKTDGSARGTIKSLVTIMNRVKNYEAYINKLLYFNDMTLTFSDNFSIYLRKEMKYNENSVEKTFTTLKTVLNHYYKRRIELNISLSDIFKDEDWKRGRKQANAAHPLKPEDFNILLNYDFKTDLAMVRTQDRFLIQCSTGLRFCDLFRIKPDMIVNNCIKINPQKTRNKTDNTIYIDLNDISNKILKKYDYDTSVLNISNQKYNESLKTMFDRLGLEKYTSHDARDTFISYAVSSGIDVPTILSWSGQESYDIMKRYVKITDEHKANQMKKVF